MQPSTLYYPEFEPPLDWLKTFLLFHNNIARIVPSDVDDFESDDFKRFREKFPDVVIDIPATQDLIDLDQLQFDRLNKAFYRIASEIDTSDEFIVEINQEGDILYPGYVFLHRNKVSDSIEQLLQTHDLAPQILQELILNETTRQHSILVEEKAANLILSILADKVARDRGLDTVTDTPIDFSLLALNGMGIGPLSGSIPGGRVNKLLVSTVLTAQVPKSLASLTDYEYNELRKEYLELQEPLKRAISQQQAIQEINPITNAEQIEQHLKSAGAEFVRQLTNARKKTKFQNIKHWSPYAIITLVDTALAFSLEPKVAVPLVGVTAVVAGVDKLLSKPDQSQQELARINRQLFGLKRRLFLKELAGIVQDLL